MFLQFQKYDYNDIIGTVRETPRNEKKKIRFVNTKTNINVY